MINTNAFAEKYDIERLTVQAASLTLKPYFDPAIKGFKSPLFDENELLLATIKVLRKKADDARAKANEADATADHLVGLIK